MTEYRWTVRNIDPDCVSLIEEVSADCGLAYGDLVNQAIATWYEQLPEAEDEREQADTLIPQPSCTATAGEPLR